MAKEHKLPRPAGSITDEQLRLYAEQFHEAGDRRRLAEEVLRLRKLCDSLNEILLGEFGREATKDIRLPAEIKQKDEDIF